MTTWQKWIEPYLDDGIYWNETFYNEVIQEIEDEWIRYSFSIIDSVLLWIGWFLFLFHETGYSAGFIVVGGAIDLPIIWLKRRTITSWIRKQFKKWADRIILVVKLSLMGISILTWKTPPTRYDALLAIAITCIVWHLFANEGDE